MTSFSELGLSTQALHALDLADFKAPTPIQAQAIPLALTGQDLIGCAATGTGKTAAFVLPILERLRQRSPELRVPRALILAPTRELAVQIAEQTARFAQGSQIRFATLIGGVSQGAQMRELSRGPQVIIATPGRLVDHLQQRSVRLESIEVLVLDEADRMLDMGFKPQLTQILAKVPRQRQTLLFSATMAGEVADFAKRNLQNPATVRVNPVGTTAQRAEQRVYLVPQEEKSALLLALLQEDQESTLVFTRTKRRADKVAKALVRAGHSATRIHADRSQSQRQQALAGFKRGEFRVLVATDIAARGIDVADIGQVVNYDLPHVPADYVHRIGRTARASATGRACSFAAPDENALLRDIERYTRQPLPRAAVPRESEHFQAEMKASAERTSGQAGTFRKPGNSRPKSPKPNGLQRRKWHN